MSHRETITDDIPQAIAHQLTVRLHLEEGPANPRKDFDTAARLWLKPSRDFSDIDDAPDLPWFFDSDYRYGYEPEMGDIVVSWDQPEHIAAALRKRGYEVVGININSYDHTLTPTDDTRADGFGYMSRTDILNANTYGDKHPQRVTARMRQNAREIITAEIEQYSQWASGDVWGVVISEEETDDDGDPTGVETELDSCWRFYGYDYAKEEAARMVAEIISSREENTRDTNKTSGIVLAQTKPDDPARGRRGTIASCRIDGVNGGTAYDHDQPARRIDCKLRIDLTGAGMSQWTTVLGIVRSVDVQDYRRGYPLWIEEYVDLIKAGIVPLKREEWITDHNGDRKIRTTFAPTAELIAASAEWFTEAVTRVRTRITEQLAYYAANPEENEA